MNTIAEVAKRAEVSVATVSRVLNNSAKVSPAARQRVLEAVAALNYHPNALGRSLRKSESKMLLVSVPNISNPYYADIVTGIEDTASAAGYHIMICMTSVGHNSSKEYAELLRNGSADGAITLEVTHDGQGLLEDFAGSRPLVQCCEYCKDPSVGHVSIDNFAASKQVTEYLLSLGHRRIGFISTKNGYISTLEREAGFKSAIESCRDVIYFGIEYADANYNCESGARAAQAFLSLPEPPTAIFCVSDTVAIGTIRAATDMGLSVPKDLSVVGFDDVIYATMFNPELTTVRQPGYELGKCACEMLLRQFAGAPPEEIFLPHGLIIRGSTANLPLNK